MAWWVKFADGTKACVERPKDIEPADFQKEQVIAFASVLAAKVAVDADTIPYPASPRLNEVAYGDYGPCPPFCYTPDRCVGRGSCPKDYACSE